MLRRHLQTIATLAAPLRLPLVRYHGRLHGSGAQATLLAAALAPTADFVAGAVMAVDRREPQDATVTPPGIRGAAFAAAGTADDLVVAELPWLWRGLLPARFTLSFPAWVSQEIRATGDGPLVVAAPARKEAMRLTRREGYSVELADGAAEAGRFYHELYRPYVAQRFGEGALLVDEARFRETARGMTLAKLHARGEWVAGLLFRIAGGTLSLGWFGSRTMPPPAGASEALDAWVIGHAAGLGVRRAVLGHSRPSLADGVVRYKARFGAVIRATRFPQRVVGVEIRRPTAAVVQALNAARFVTFDGSPGMRELIVRPAL